MATPHRQRQASRLTALRSLVVCVCLTLAACSSEPRPGGDLIQQIIDATPASQVALHAFRDRVVIANKTTTSATACVVVLDGDVRGELGAMPAGQTLTLMRTRFRPYLEPDDFYARANKDKRIDCVADGKPVSVKLGAPVEHTVIIPSKR